MARMGRYCKAYPVARLREFSGWIENTENPRIEKKMVDGKEIETATELTGDSYLYLQENYTVTESVLLDENIIFDQVSPEWIAFCKETLKFEVPVDHFEAETKTA